MGSSQDLITWSDFRLVMGFGKPGEFYFGGRYVQQSYYSYYLLVGELNDMQSQIYELEGFLKE